MLFKGRKFVAGFESLPCGPVSPIFRTQLRCKILSPLILRCEWLPIAPSLLLLYNICINKGNIYEKGLRESLLRAALEGVIVAVIASQLVASINGVHLVVIGDSN